jgi:hypothetical protein
MSVFLLQPRVLEARPTTARSRARPAIPLIAALSLLGVVPASIPGCAAGDPTLRDDTPPPRIIAADAPSPVLEGTLLRIVGEGLHRVGTDPVLEIRASIPDGAGATYVVPAAQIGHEGEYFFEVPRELIVELGAGTLDVDLILAGPIGRTERFLQTWEIATDLPLTIDAVPSGTVHRDEIAVIRGSGFASASEGASRAHFSGSFTLIDGSTDWMEVDMPIALLEPSDRSRAAVVLTTDLGGLWPGTFDGWISITSELDGGSVRTSEGVYTTLEFGPPEIFDVGPETVSLGERLSLRGNGLLGGEGRPSETTLLLLEGTFTPTDGTPTEIGPMELVAEVASSTEVRLGILTEVRGGSIVSRLFGAARGRFEGSVVPIVITASDRFEGSEMPFSFELVGVEQVVHIRFLPGFHDSLHRFGLASARREIEEGIVERIESIYAGYSLDVRLEEPVDFDPSAYSILEIGGPDPNGFGLIGHDNSTSKDIGNLRLSDHLAGENVMTGIDGDPSFGGVFIESILWWSSHPELPVARPGSSAVPDPLFDRLFDPVRGSPATLAEARGEGEPARVEQVRAAIHALSSIVGETAAHEIGHSIGMAQPFGSATAFHNDSDAPGCLMDRGGHRPLAERAAQPGAAETRFCYDEPEYLGQILGL